MTEQLIFHKKVLIPQSSSSISQSISQSSSIKLDITYDEIVITNKSRIKCYCISDIHADSEKNQEWVKDKCKRNDDDTNVFTILIIPGDIGSEMNKIERVFKHVSNVYDIVCYVPGNHELWKRGSIKSTKECMNSIEKLYEVMECASSFPNIRIGPIRISFTEQQQNGLCIFPLYSWYHSGFDTEPDLIHPTYLNAERAFPFVAKWGDFNMCSWPEKLINQKEFSTIKIEEDNTTLAEAFGNLNEPFLKDKNIVQVNDTVISFSHFVPRLELLPEKRFLLEPLLSRVVGSNVLESQIRRLQPSLHLFGHTHIPIDLELDGIRYLQYPLGYSREAEMQCKLIVQNGPLLVYDSFLNGISCDGTQDMNWTKYYKENNRNPLIVDQLAPWLEARLKSFL